MTASSEPIGGRFSPARAGNGDAHAARGDESAVQPRACGEREPFPKYAVGRRGSAPRVRGTGINKGLVTWALRFSPARAGNGSSEHTKEHVRSVQPRACGERVASYCASASAAGSAPRVRGTDNNGGECLMVARFSPARAGNGLAGAASQYHCPVQPRACGERIKCQAACTAWVGSAPRVRGTEWSRHRLAARVRFSPARAGNGSCGLRTDAASPVQPRACGERPKKQRVRFQNVGSAPRVRGTGMVGGCSIEDGRFSPARAGNGPLGQCSIMPITVQPRACGERRT